MVSLGVSRALRRRDIALRAFKKGPDYIDAAWLSLAARAPQGNLDPFFTPGQSLLEHFSRMASGYALALVEGNRGLFDGLDLQGSCSTAEVSRVLRAPLILVLDCAKMTRTAAALVKGCMNFEPGLHIAGVILNRTGAPRHQTMLRAAIEELCGLPVLGTLPRKSEGLMEERRTGLFGIDEYAQADAHLDQIADFVSAHVDMDALLRLAEYAPDLPDPLPDPLLAGGAPQRIEAVDLSAKTSGSKSVRPRRPRIGYVRDAAFWFYYQENLDALHAAGADLQALSLLDASPWPAIDGLYIGGGTPELHAEALSANREKRSLVAALSRAGLPIYAESGGFAYLTQSLRIEGRDYPMAGIFPCSVEFCPAPQGLGYVSAEVLNASPFHPAGCSFRGHEFQFSRCVFNEPDEKAYLFRLHRGKGMAAAPDQGRRDGLLLYNTFAAYTYVYAPALPLWAANFVSLCLRP